MLITIFIIKGVLMNLNIKEVIPIIGAATKWVAIGGSIVLGIAYIYGLISALIGNAEIKKILYEHLLAVLGVPGAIIISLVLITILEQVSGKIKMKGFGIEFEGASGPIILWVIVFMAIVSSLHMLW